MNLEKPTQQQLNTLLEYYQNGKYIEAEKLSISITQEFPKHPFAWKVLGAVLKQIGKISESLIAYQKSVQLDPQDAEAYYNLGITLKQMNRLNEAETNYKKAITLKPDFVEAHNNLGITLKQMNRLNEAEKNFRKALILKPEFVEAHNNLGIMLQELGKLEEAKTNYRKAIELKPDYAKAHYNLGLALKELGKLDEAEASFKKTIALKPDYAEAHNNLGIILNELEKLEEAVASYKKSTTLKPEYAEAWSNMGITLNDLGKLEEAVACYKKAIELKPDYTIAWNNLFFSLKAIKFKNPSVDHHLPLLDKKVINTNAQISKSILNYHLNLGNPSADKFLKETLNILSSADNILIKNPKVPSKELIKPTLPKKMTALLHFGRGGSGLIHSLIDGHPEISTLPSIYFSDFFDISIWEKITLDGWEKMADNFVSTYEVLFNASSTVPILLRSKLVYNIEQREGMTGVGEEKNEVLSVDKKAFKKKLKQLMDCYDHLDAFVFFKLVHSAYEFALENFNEKDHIFYHIHHHATLSQLNFLSFSTNTNWLMMVRDPIQSCESWSRNSFHVNDYKAVANKIIQMLIEIDQPIFQNDNSIGVKLEDLKEQPKKTMQALCDWMGIKEKDSLYKMTAQGKKWWGDPSSPDYAKDGMNAFGKVSINRKVGLIFSENDQFVLRTLFYPFSVRFGYVEENLNQFKNDLQTIRPMLDQMFDFEKKITEQTKANIENFMQSGAYIYLRSGLIERWNTLNKFHTYSNMLNPMKIT